MTDDRGYIPTGTAFEPYADDDGGRFAPPPGDIGMPMSVARVKPTLVRPSQFQGRAIPERQWIVTDWMPSGVVTGLYGDGGLGKTLLAQMLQTACAVGQSWIGLETEKVSSLAMYCEDDEEELWRRQAKIDQLYGCDFKDLDDCVWLPRLGDDNTLVHFDRSGKAILTPLYHDLLEMAQDHRAKLVTIDTAADTFGGNENDRSQVRQYVSMALGGIARAIGGAVLCCAHPSRAGMSSGTGDSGSTGWSNTFRSRLYLHAPTDDDGNPVDPDARLLSRKKANYAARNDEVKLRWRDGAFVIKSEASRMFRRPPTQVFLELLDKLAQEKRPVSSSERASNFAPRLFAQRSANEREDYKNGDFRKAMEELFRQNTITNEEYGRSGDRRMQIVRASDD